MSNVENPIYRNWSESAPYWDKHRQARQWMFSRLGPALCAEAGVPGTAVPRPYELLDVAAGPGDASIDLAQLLGGNATVWYTDLVPDMVRIAERTARERGVTNVRIRQCAAESLAFDANFFDAVLCRFGIMFFTDPLAAVRDALRVVKLGCRVAYCVWGTREANAFHHVVQDVLDRYVPGPSADPDAPGAYRFAQGGKLASVVREAGATDIHDHAFRFNIEAPLSFDQFFEVRTEMSDSLRDKLRRMKEEQKAAFKEDVRKESRSYFNSRGCSFPAEVLLVSGQKLG
jgi:SAM-dependent methyltransferase